MSSANKYCKELASQFGLTPIYLPGTDINPGDVIRFSEHNLLGFPKPIGTFTKTTSLANYNCFIEIERNDNPRSYYFSSKKGISISFNAEVKGDSSKIGHLKIDFSMVGATYVAALGCVEERIKDISKLETQLSLKKEQLDWSQHFIVLSVIRAGKALAVQSNDKKTCIEITGDVSALAKTDPDCSPQISLKTSSFSGSAMYMDWTENAPIFFRLLRYRKKLLRDWGIQHGKFGSPYPIGDFSLLEVDSSEIIDD